MIFKRITQGRGVARNTRKVTVLLSGNAPFTHLLSQTDALVFRRHLLLLLLAAAVNQFITES